MTSVDKIEDRLLWKDMKTPTVMERMLELYKTSKWHDCVFKLINTDGSGEELVFAHNLVLATCSPVFEALCFGPLAEVNPIQVPDVDPVAFKLLIQFIYTDYIEFNSVETACNVLYASKKYLIYSLVNLSISYISHHINETNCLQIHKFAVFLQEESLVKESWGYLCSHLDSVFKYLSDESLTIDFVKNLVNEQALNGNEEIVFKICVMWAELECSNSNLEKTSDNIRQVLLQADILNKIRWLTFTVEEFEAGPKKSGILTADEVQFILKSLKVIQNYCKECDKENCLEHKSNCNSVVDSPKTTAMNDLDRVLQECRSFAFSISSNFESRKKIQLKEFYCHRFIEQETKLTLDVKDIKIRTFIQTNKSVRLTAIFLHAKVLPISHLNNRYCHSYAAERDYNEKLFLSICDSNSKTLFSTPFCQKVSYGKVFKIPLPKPILIECSEEYYVQIDLLDSPENYLFGIRNPKTKFPSGLCVSFREQANIGCNGSFIDTKYLSIINGLNVSL